MPTEQVETEIPSYYLPQKVKKSHGRTTESHGMVTVAISTHSVMGHTCQSVRGSAYNPFHGSHPSHYQYHPEWIKQEPRYIHI